MHVQELACRLRPKGIFPKECFTGYGLGERSLVEEASRRMTKAYGMTRLIASTRREDWFEIAMGDPPALSPPSLIINANLWLLHATLVSLLPPSRPLDFIPCHVTKHLSIYLFSLPPSRPRPWKPLPSHPFPLPLSHFSLVHLLSFTHAHTHGTTNKLLTRIKSLPRPL